MSANRTAPSLRIVRVSKAGSPAGAAFTPDRSGLAGPDGSNGQAVIDQMNALGGIYINGVFQPHHNRVGQPTYGFPWFYVSYVPMNGGVLTYQIVEFGSAPAGN